MPTFFDSTVDAAEASEALRGLAHASRTFDQPAQMYGGRGLATPSRFGGCRSRLPGNIIFMQLTEQFDKTLFPIDVIEAGIKALDPEPVVVGLGNSFSITQDSRSWSLDTLDEWLGEYARGFTSARMDFHRKRMSLSVSVWAQNSEVTVYGPDKASIERVMRVFTAQAPRFVTPEPPEPIVEPVKPTIFIGHGGVSGDWRILKDELHDKHGYTIEAYETGARSGHNIRDILDSMLDASSFALLMMTGEDETADGSMRARQNVVHEAGLFQGRLGFNRAIAVVEEGVEVFSNLDGVQHIPYATGHVKSTVSDVLATLTREFPGHR